MGSGDTPVPFARGRAGGRGLTRRYRDKLALDHVSVDIAAGSITGLLGRNGAGKTTLLRIIAGHEFASEGRVKVASPVMFVREDHAYPDFKVRDALRAASWFYPNWSVELADTLQADFALPPSRGVKKLSRGMRSALGIVIGLASRAEITMLDEPYAGLDAVASQLFYDRLLAEYTEHRARFCCPLQHAVRQRAHRPVRRADGGSASRRLRDHPPHYRLSSARRAVVCRIGAGACRTGGGVGCSRSRMRGVTTTPSNACLLTLAGWRIMCTPAYPTKIVPAANTTIARPAASLRQDGGGGDGGKLTRANGSPVTSSSTSDSGGVAASSS
jgi:ABC-type branched-subunit amino acid transport system ATPase component